MLTATRETTREDFDSLTALSEAILWMPYNQDDCDQPVDRHGNPTGPARVPASLMKKRHSQALDMALSLNPECPAVKNALVQLRAIEL